jgi:hypothetical protein
MRRKGKSAPLRVKPWPAFLAWCPDEKRFDAFTLALSALVGEAGQCTVWDFTKEDEEDGYLLPPAKAAELARPGFDKHGWQRAHIEFVALSGRELEFCANVHLDRRREPGFTMLDLAFWTEAYTEGYLLPDKLPRLKRGNPISTALEAGIAWQLGTWDAYDILVRLCTSSPAITTGGCGEGPDWGAPITMAITYHADGNPSRDLALSWIRLHDKEPIDLAAGLPIEELRARVEASPPGSSVWVIDEDRLAREEVLAALDLPPDELLAAVAAAAKKRDPEWLKIENDLLRVLNEITKSPAEDREMVPVTEEHINFIEQHTPIFIHRLDNGAVVLAANPDRTLWPLWADALRLLGIRP